MIGNPVVVGALVALSREIKAPGNSISLTLEKKIFGVWTEIPCIDNIGSCTYDNACDLVPLVVQPSKDFEKKFQNIIFTFKFFSSSLS